MHNKGNKVKKQPTEQEEIFAHCKDLGFRKIQDLNPGF